MTICCPNCEGIGREPDRLSPPNLDQRRFSLILMTTSGHKYTEEPCVVCHGAKYVVTTRNDISPTNALVHEAKSILQSWVDKQGHERCWYYPDIFLALCMLLGVRQTKEKLLPSEKEFEDFCTRYRKEEYNESKNIPSLG